ncbi:ankyrin-2 [Diabrotica virgifera virgifera]|uniref:Ankyrin-2 n=1 Tax=Diabrotica virgifera virgifera TaxID=50390 RepID=A0A6P7FU41_DIAVI|nr:ankyrin-2 [Diabrotica virgifera virgifera]XP_050497651.1 ankyrin-2 [Diabrotica virgifera virgifera]XP_050497652.1 ankyrin-2 [Diabrotica virgifera virgifera]XP_050497653.1 ankyrin-2 [Diabrotica virgifera virgifera]
MGGQVSQVFQSGSALLTNGHGHKVSDSTRQKVQTIFDALRANPKIGVQRLEGLLQQLPRNENILAIHDETGYNLLQKCVGANNVELVRWLLARHSAADVNRFPCSLPLHIACLKGHDECVELLLKHGAKSDVEVRMCWPGPHSSNCEERGKYSTAVQHEETCIERDTRERAPNNKLQSALYYALDGDQVNILTMLSQRGEDPWNGIFRARKPLLHSACERGAWKCTEYLIRERSDEIHLLKDEYYPIHYAVLHDSKFLELLIDHGADTTVRTCTQQMTLLHVVLLVAHKSAEDTIATIRLLLDHGCKELINTPDSLGNTPLHALIVRYALEEAQYGYDKWNKWNKWDILHLVRYLIQNGARQSINHAGNSAVACVLRHVRDWDVCYELLNMLLNEDGDPNMVGRDGSVPLMVCLVPLINKDPLHHFTHSMKVCYLNCIKILLKHGANSNCSYRANLTPLHVLVFTVSENITLNCNVQKRLNFEFIKNLLILLLNHDLNPNARVTRKTEHIFQKCMDMVLNVRDCMDLHYVYDLTLTLIQFGANPDLSLNMSEAIRRHPLHSQSIWNTKNYILYYYITLISRKENLITDPHLSFAKIILLFYCVMQHKPLFECLKILYTQQLSLVPGKTTEPLTAIIRDLYKRPRTLKQICRVKIHNCLGRRPGLFINKLDLPNQLKDYLLNFQM